MVSLFQMHFEFHHSDTIRKVSLSKIMFIIITDINSLSYCLQTGTEDQHDLRNHTKCVQYLGNVTLWKQGKRCISVSYLKWTTQRYLFKQSQFISSTGSEFIKITIVDRPQLMTQASWGWSKSTGGGVPISGHQLETRGLDTTPGGLKLQGPVSIPRSKINILYS